MNQHSSDESVHVTGEERLHPALRKLGRACIALARWQRRQDAQRHTAREATADDAAPPPTASIPPPTGAAPAASEQEQGHE